MEDVKAAAKSVKVHADKNAWEDALLTLNGDFSGLEYPDRRAVYDDAKAYFTAKATAAGVDLPALYAEYETPV